MEEEEIETQDGESLDPAHDTLQNGFAMGMGAALVLFGLIRILYAARILGVFSTSHLQGIFHVLAGGMYVWAGASRTLVARGFNNFLGACFLLLAAIQFALVVFGDYGLAPDAIVDLIVGITSVSMGQTDRLVPKKGVNFMEATNWPFTK